jgi:hypothetical protein
LTIACGESLNSQAATIDTITARLVDHSSSAITCQASIVANGVVQWTSGSASTTANAATVVQLTFTAPAGTAGKGFMSCTLPVKSGSNRSSVNGYEQTFFLPT